MKTYEEMKEIYENRIKELKIEITLLNNTVSANEKFIRELIRRVNALIEENNLLSIKNQKKI